MLVSHGHAHHADWSEGHETVTAIAVGPGVPARIFPLLQDEHLPTEVSLLEGNPTEGGGGVWTEWRKWAETWACGTKRGRNPKGWARAKKEPCRAQLCSTGRCQWSSKKTFADVALELFDYVCVCLRLCVHNGLSVWEQVLRLWIKECYMRLSPLCGVTASSSICLDAVIGGASERRCLQWLLFAVLVLHV